VPGIIERIHERIPRVRTIDFLQQGDRQNVSRCRIDPAETLHEKLFAADLPLRQSLENSQKKIARKTENSETASPPWR
jgi:hypothetical protein